MKGVKEVKREGGEDVIEVVPMIEIEARGPSP